MKDFIIINRVAESLAYGAYSMYVLESTGNAHFLQPACSKDSLNKTQFYGGDTTYDTKCLMAQCIKDMTI